MVQAIVNVGLDNLNSRSRSIGPIGQVGENQVGRRFSVQLNVP